MNYSKDDIFEINNMRLVITTGFFAVYILQLGLCGRLLPIGEPCNPSLRYNNGCNRCMCGPDNTMTCDLAHPCAQLLSVTYIERFWEGDPWVYTRKGDCILATIYNTDRSIDPCV